MHKSLDRMAIRKLLPFSPTYLYESGFSTFMYTKTKYRDKHDCRSWSEMCIICYKVQHSTCGFQTTATSFPLKRVNWK